MSHSTVFRIASDPELSRSLDRGDRGSPRSSGSRARSRPRSKPGVRKAPGAFAKAHRDGVVISDNGRVRLGHALAPLGAIGVERVWDLARTREGILLAATGDCGKVLGREPKAGATWNVVYDSSDSQVLSLVVTPDGISYAGTGPDRPGGEPDRSQASCLAA